MEDTERKLAESLGIPFRIEQKKIGEHTINFLVAGQGKPVILLHGGNIGWGQWYPNIPVLAEHFTVYAVDMPGAGRSSRINYEQLDTEKDFVDIVEAFIRELHLASPHIIGSSIGGWIGLKLVLRKTIPLGKLVLADSVGFMGSVRPSDRVIGLYPIAQFLAHTLLKPVRSNPNIESFLRGVFYDKKTAIRKEFIEYFYKTMETSHNLLLISRLGSVWGMRREFVLIPQLPSIMEQILVLWGKNDALMPVRWNEKAVKTLPNGRLEVIPNAGHIPSIEQSETFNKIVLGFLLAS